MRAFFLEREQAFLRYADLPGAEPGCVFVHGAWGRSDLVSDLVLAEAGFPEGPQGFASFAAGKTEDEYLAWFAHFINQRLEDAKHEDSVLPIHLGMAQAAAPWAVYRTSQSLNAGDLQPTLRERFLSARMPRAYFVGARSELDEEDEALRVDLEAAGGDWAVVANAEHQMNFDNPAGFAEAIARRV